MKILIRGMESPEYLALLLQLCKIRSDRKIAAINSHLCRGLSAEMAADLNEVKPQNLRSAINRLEKIAAIVEDIKHLKH